MMQKSFVDGVISWECIQCNYVSKYKGYQKMHKIIFKNIGILRYDFYFKFCLLLVRKCCSSSVFSTLFHVF